MSEPVIPTQGVCIVKFTAEWCGPCQNIKVPLKKALAKYPHVAFVEIDVDKHDDIAQKYRVNAMPSIVYIKQGNEVANLRTVGANMSAIEASLDALAQMWAPSSSEKSDDSSQILLPQMNDAEVKCQTNRQPSHASRR